MIDKSISIPLDSSDSFGCEPNIDASLALMLLRMGQAPVNESNLAEAFGVLHKQLSALGEPAGKVGLLYRHIALTESFSRWLFARAQQAARSSDIEKLTKAALMAQNAASRLCAVVSVLENQPQNPNRLRLSSSPETPFEVVV